MNIKTKNVSEANQQAMEIDGLNKYLAAGNGRGRLNSAANVYNGEVGYFFVGKIDVGGVQQESILFSRSQTDHGLTSNDDIVITEFPAHPKY